MSGPAASDRRDWLARFHKRHGRPLRVLHIGNVANNAYLNAKILRAAGVDCDVLCSDYYHIMGCPEWEDADFRGPIADQFYPDWEAVHLRSFRRPAWFAQGPMRACIAYLEARCRGQRLLAWWRWNYLRARRWYTCSRQLGELRKAAAAVRAGPAGRAARCARRLAIHGSNLARAVARRMRQGIPDVAQPPSAVLGEGSGGPLPRKPVSGLERDEGGTWFERRVAGLIAQFAQVFPERPDRLAPEDLARSRDASPWWRGLLAHYDVVVGYATEGKWPLLAGARPYLAYEHGTIRNIPFEDNAQGRLCALTYRLADGVFITNCDNIRSAGRLKLDNYRFIPHAVNEEIGGSDEAVRQLRADLRARLNSDFLIFHPPRQHWEPRRHPDWEKGNDVLIRGFARFVHEVNPRAGAVMVEWGQTIPQSKDLLASLGVADRVLWVPPQPNVAMIRYTRACDLLADQFFLGAFGSTMPKALLHGCPAMLYLDEERHQWCFPEMPPVINARTPAEVLKGLSRVYQEPGYARDLVARGRRWYERYHSNQVIAETFLESFRAVLDRGATTTHTDCDAEATSPRSRDQAA